MVWLQGGDPHQEEERTLRQKPVNSSIQTLVRLRSSRNDKVAVGGTQEGFHSNWDLSWMQKGGQDLNLGWQQKELHQLLPCVHSCAKPAWSLLPRSRLNTSSFLRPTISCDARAEKETPSPTQAHNTLFILLLLRELQAQS